MFWIVSFCFHTQEIWIYFRGFPQNFRFSHKGITDIKKIWRPPDYSVEKSLNLIWIFLYLIMLQLKKSFHQTW